MDTKTTFEVMEKALPFVLDLIRDEEVVEFKEKFRGEEKEDVTLGEAMEKLMGIFLIRKRDVVIKLLSVVTGKSVEEIEKQEYSVTKIELKNLLNGDIFDFFTWSLHMATKA